MTKAKPKSKHKKPGPVPQVIDLALVERLAQRQGSVREIAACLGISEALLRSRMKKDDALQEAIERGHETGRTTLRVRQYNVAMAGNPALLIWLGKQYLGQSDKSLTELTGKDGGPVQTTSFAELFALAQSAGVTTPPPSSAPPAAEAAPHADDPDPSANNS